MLRLAAVILLASLAQSGSSLAETWLDDPEQYRWAQGYMLQIINEERARRGLNSLRPDPLAAQAAKQHADEMLAGDYLSHWNLAGQKPARRYNLLGGFDALSENVYYYHGQIPDWQELVVRQMEVLMESDGHRAAILDPAKTHVGLGFAADGDGFYSSQEFITRIGGEYHCPLSARVGDTVEFSGRFDPARHGFAYLLVSFEEPEQPRNRMWLENSESYRDGDKLVAGYVADPSISFREVETLYDVTADQSSGRFSASVCLDYKGKQGVYYLLVYFRDLRSEETAMAASVAIVVSN